MESTFQVRDVAPDVFLIGNLGVVQAREFGPARVVELAKRIGADAMAIHLNPAMELIQADGDRDFSGSVDTLRSLVGELGAVDIPVIAKETGCGLSVGGTVMLWIERQEKSGSKAVLKLEGQLVGDWVSVLEEECRKILKEKKLLALEMAEVTYVSQRGVHLLRRLTAENVNLVNCSSLIENLL